MVQDLDPFLGVSADREVVNEQQLDPRIIPDPLAVLVQIFLPVENNQFVQQVAIVHKLTAVITPACLYTTGRQEIRLASTGDSINPYILSVLSKVEFQDLFNSGVIIDATIAGFQFFSHSTLIDQAAEPQVRFKPLIEGFYVLRLQDLTKELQSGIAAELEAVLNEYAGLREQAQGVDPVHLYEARQAIRPDKEQEAENRAQQVYGEKYSPLLMFDSKKAVSRILHEDIERQAVRRMVRKAQKEQQTSQKKKSKERER